ncbi:hypothetical protein Tco_1253615 [Tanacetum coccineum]
MLPLAIGVPTKKLKAKKENATVEPSPNSPNLEVVRKNIKAIKEVIENEPHLISEIEEERKLEIVVAMVEEEVPYFEEVSRVSKRSWGEVGGVENKSSMGSMLIAKGEECMDGWVGAGGGEVKGV